MSDIRLVDYSGDEDTILRFECPTLGDAAPQFYEQREFAWSAKPAWTDTGFDLLGDVVSDISAGNSDSERFDRSLLRQVAGFREGLDNFFYEIDFAGSRYTPAQPAILTRETIRTAKKLTAHTPDPVRVRIVGTLDMIRASTQAFAIQLDDGQEVRGVVTTGEVRRFLDLLEKRVLLLGKAIFRPSGRLLRVDADELSEAGPEDVFFSKMPLPGRRTITATEVSRQQSRKRGVAAIIGRWPGEESDEAIAAALKDID